MLRRHVISLAILVIGLVVAIALVLVRVQSGLPQLVGIFGLS